MERNAVQRDNVVAAFRGRLAMMRIKQTELAFRLGVHPNFLNQILNGYRELTPQLEREMNIELEIYARATQAGKIAAQAERERATLELRGPPMPEELAPEGIAS